MTNLHPNFKLIEPAHPADQLSEAVIGALSRWMNPRLAWKPVMTLVLGLISGGVLPLVVQQKRFRDFIIAERTHLWHLAEWLRLEFPSPETAKFQQAIPTLRFRPAFWIGGIAFTILAFWWAWHDLSRTSAGFSPLRMITPQFLFDFAARLPQFVRQFTEAPQVLFAAAGFQLLLVAAQLTSLWQVFAHVGDVATVVDQYNIAAKKHSLPQLVAPSLRTAFGPVWLIAAAAAAALGSLWGVPMVLAGAAQAGYINRSGRLMRLSLAASVYNELAARRPALQLPMPAALRGKCVRGNCTAPLPAGAGWCPRCGERAIAVPQLA